LLCRSQADGGEFLLGKVAFGHAITKSGNTKGRGRIFMVDLLLEVAFVIKKMYTSSKVQLI